MDLEKRKRTLRRAWRIIEAGMASAKTPAGRSRIEEIQLHADGYAEPGCDADVAATGNWNSLTRYDKETRQSVVVDDTIGRVSACLEKLGVELEWCDEWTTCDGCHKLVRTSPDCYSWSPSYVDLDGETLCVDCVDPEEHLSGLEGNPNTANTVESIDPADHGYVRVDEEYEAGWHPGQDSEPKLIAKALEKQGIRRYLFNIDGRGQFDTRFSVYVHESEHGKLDTEKFAAEQKDGPSRARAMERQLMEASAQMDKLKGDGIKLASLEADGTVTARLVSHEEFIAGVKR